MFGACLIINTLISSTNPFKLKHAETSESPVNSWRTTPWDNYTYIRVLSTVRDYDNYCSSSKVKITKVDDLQATFIAAT